MPTYQYACTACSHQLEAVQSFTDDPLTQCPECEGRLRKRFGSVGIVFKGSGFYRTDSRAGADAKINGNGSAAKSKDEAGSGATAGKSGDSKTTGDSKAGGATTSGSNSTPSKANDKTPNKAKTAS